MDVARWLERCQQDTASVSGRTANQYVPATLANSRSTFDFSIRAFPSLTKPFQKAGSTVPFLTSLCVHVGSPECTSSSNLGLRLGVLEGYVAAAGRVRVAAAHPGMLSVTSFML